MELPPVFERYRSAVEGELRTALEGRTLLLYDMLRYHLGWTDPQGHPEALSGGKRLRPTLCLLACEAAGGDWRSALPAAAAVELVHNFSLIHDDIQDGDRERRHRPTVWSLWGVGEGINAGDGMLTLACLAVLRLSSRGVDHARTVLAANVLHAACLRVIEGQHLDMSYEQRMDVTVPDYLAMIERKTGALIEAAVDIGAVLGTADEAVVARLRRYAHALGLAFQVVDDVLGIWGDPAVLGKDALSDIRRRKKTLPVIYALEHASAAARETLTRVYGKRTLTEDDVSRVVDVLESVQARRFALRTADQYYREAVAELDAVAVGDRATGELKEVARFVVQRDR
ncbi:MAG: polyprenyl synthetase family protein [Dehalococcoidia bacterium]|nr:polyprenyl synthetase family protein [Dehalococcoidia bacterium]